VKGLAVYWPFLIECLAFFNNFVGRFWSFFMESLAFYEKINLATLHVMCAVGLLEVGRMVVPTDFVMSLYPFAVMLPSQKLACDVII